MRYPVRAPERGPRWQTHAQRRNLGISVRPGHPAPAATLPAIPAAAPSGAQDYRWFVRDPLGLTPPGYELAPIRGWTRLLHERGMKADSMPERLLIGPGSPPSLDPVYPELSPPLEPCQNVACRSILTSCRVGSAGTGSARGSDGGPNQRRAWGVGLEEGGQWPVQPKGASVERKTPKRGMVSLRSLQSLRSRCVAAPASAG